MLNEHTLDQLRGLRLDGMVHALADQATSASAGELAFDDRLAMLVQREIDWRDAKRLTRLLKAAKLKIASACLEDIDWRARAGSIATSSPRWPEATGCATGFRTLLSRSQFTLLVGDE